MFFDLDILNRRGGKFGVIWLAAHNKLSSRGKDLTLLMNVNVARTW